MIDNQGRWEREVEARQRAQATALIGALGKTNVCFPQRHKLKHPKLTKKQVREIMKQLKGMEGVDP